MAGELTNLEAWNVACHHLVPASPSFYDHLGGVGGRACLIASLIVDGILQLPSVSCDLQEDNSQSKYSSKVSGANGKTMTVGH